MANPSPWPTIHAEREALATDLESLSEEQWAFLGGVGGVAIAFGLTVIANVVINNQLASNGIRSSNIIGVPAWLAIAVMGGTTIIGVLAGLGPAARAARLNPVDALRYE
jgi:putative ABC transport system permease protein